MHILAVAAEEVTIDIDRIYVDFAIRIQIRCILIQIVSFFTMSFAERLAQKTKKIIVRSSNCENVFQNTLTADRQFRRNGHRHRSV